MINKKASQFILPAEWQKHEATWIGWPHNKEDWPGKFSPIPFVYAEIVRIISKGEIVRILVENDSHEKKARKVLKSVGVEFTNIEFYKIKTDRNWLRDAAPQFVIDKDGHLNLMHFKFNAWAKYSNYKKDKYIPGFISHKLKLPIHPVIHNGHIVVLEGGAIDINGKGTLLTTEECLLDPKVQVRNKNFTKQDYAGIFNQSLGIKNIIWLGKGIKGDDTHGHIDDLCRFVNENTILIVSEDNEKDENYIPLKENYEKIQDAVLEDGSKPRIIKLPMPSPVMFKGERLPASYANFYISNYAVLVPTFNDPNDKKALGILSDLFPNRKVIGIHSVDLVWGLGTLHCLTHEQPFIDFPSIKA
ncbi:MAG: agmatine deiminase family protein [Ignavibacteriaceae bacterium]|nr:agmatine deiminase family protein [Ignavibacteriaceae bacterium]